jgi:hypothetical protein
MKRINDAYGARIDSGEVGAPDYGDDPDLTADLGTDD